jgi:hypothetical protein
MERECHGKQEREPDDKSWRESQKLNETSPEQAPGYPKKLLLLKQS